MAESDYKRFVRAFTQLWAAPAVHPHAMSDVSGLQTALAGKSNLHDHPYAPENHDHDERYALIHDHPYESSGAVAAHVAANDPHPAYLKQAEADALYAASGHTHPAGDASWGGIGGTLSDQTDLQTALDGKAASAHNHDGSYATAAHNHDAAYAALGHNHDSAYEAKNANIQAHVSSTSNPHSVTKAQVGLGNVDNTSDASKPISTAVQAALDGKAASNHTHSLSSAQAFATAETTISAATYADIAGCSLSLAAGTWLVMGQVNIRAANAIVQAFVAITDGANAVISEVSASRPASGTASLNSPFSCNPIALVSPAGQTTYKLRGARGVTTHTGSWMAMDGNGVNTANHATNNTDKGTGIFAVKIA